MIYSFSPIVSRAGDALILGSMPGIESLRQQQYYAHPRNLFWRIIGEITGACPSLPYPQRLKKLKDAGISLWDVLHACERRGSLDAAICDETANDFKGFFSENPHISRVLSLLRLQNILSISK